MLIIVQKMGVYNKPYYVLMHGDMVIDTFLKHHDAYLYMVYLS